MKVTITGNRGEGKTSLAICLFKILGMFGYNVRLSGGNVYQTTILNDLATFHSGIRFLKGTEIEIVDREGG